MKAYAQLNLNNIWPNQCFPLHWFISKVWPFLGMDTSTPGPHLNVALRFGSAPRLSYCAQTHLSYINSANLKLSCTLRNYYSFRKQQMIQVLQTNFAVRRLSVHFAKLSKLSIMHNRLKFLWTKDIREEWCANFLDSSRLQPESHSRIELRSI